MPLDSAVLIICRGESWSAALKDISATGVSTERPSEWQSANNSDEFHLEMLVSDKQNLHVRAKLVRESEQELAFEFTEIPAGMEVPLWKLLGRYADAKE